MAFSTEEDFVTFGPEPPDGNPVISDGDLLRVGCVVCARNADLLQAFKVLVDLGLDAVDVIDVERYLVAFSTELDSPNPGQFTAGDLLITNGAVIPNAALLYGFGIRGIDLGLDAVHFIGEPAKIVEFLDYARNMGRDYWLREGALQATLRQYSLDIWFSTEGTGPYPTQPAFLDGDLLSARDGVIVVPNSLLLPSSVPAGIPNRGVDFGLDAVTCARAGNKEGIHFSTEILYEGDPSFTDGDVLLISNGVIHTNEELIRCFKPKADFVGLDALSRVRMWEPSCGYFTRVGGVHVNPTTWDYSTGYVDPVLSGLKDRPFGRWVSIRGVIGTDAVEHRVLYRAEMGIDVSIVLSNWEVYHTGILAWIPVVFDPAGWVNTAFWNDLKDNGNPDLILVNWYTRGLSDGKYILTLQIKKADGSIVTCQELPIQIDNTPPEVELGEQHECHAYDCEDEVLVVEGRIEDITFPGGRHFYRYRLALDSLWIPPTTFASGYYTDGPPLYDGGTVSWPGFDVLGTLHIPSLLGDEFKKGRYTILLWAWDRSILGGFHPPANWVNDAASNNWSYDLTNFECAP
jgi:hypothetical protein